MPSLDFHTPKQSHCEQALPRQPSTLLMRGRLRSRDVASPQGQLAGPGSGLKIDKDNNVQDFRARWVIAEIDYS